MDEPPAQRHGDEPSAVAMLESVTTTETPAEALLKGVVTRRALATGRMRGKSAAT